MKKSLRNFSEDELADMNNTIKIIQNNVVSLAQASEILGMEQASLRRRGRMGVPGYFRIGSVWLVLKSALRK